MHVTNSTTFFKVTSPGNLPSASIKILVSPNFSVPIISLIFSNTLSSI